MPRSLSKNKTNQLGDRLRKAEAPSREDLELLALVKADHRPASDEIVRIIRALDVSVTARPGKTNATIIGKLKRFKGRLAEMRDIAGARIEQPMTLSQQDFLVRRIAAALGPDRVKDVVDRRANPNHGYRAVHIIAHVEGCYVEIQVRTALQGLWAQVMEKLADQVGRGVRYGEPPDDPADVSRVDELVRVSGAVASLERAKGILDSIESEMLGEPEGREDPEVALSKLQEFDDALAGEKRALAEIEDELRLVLTRTMVSIEKDQERRK